MRDEGAKACGSESEISCRCAWNRASIFLTSSWWISDNSFILDPASILNDVGEFCVRNCGFVEGVQVEVGNYLRDAAGSRSLVFDLSITHDRIGSSCHVQQNGSLSQTQDLDAPLRMAAQRKINTFRQHHADNQNISFLPAIMTTSSRMHGEFLRLLVLQAHCETTAHFNATGLPSQQNRSDSVPVQTRGILHGPEEQSRTRGGKSIRITDQPEYPRM